MNVADLIAELQKLPQHLPVVAMANGKINSIADPYFADSVLAEEIKVMSEDSPNTSGPGPVVAIDFRREGS